MAFSRDEIEAFIAELHADPQLRDRVRNAILADDFLALPGIVARLGERVDQLSERVDQLAVQVGRLTLSVDHLNGKVGNLDGRMFEFEYERHLGNRLSKRFRKVRPIPLSDYDPFFNARRRSVISEEEWEDAARLDVIALARDTSVPSEPEVVIAMELPGGRERRGTSPSTRGCPGKVRRGRARPRRRGEHRDEREGPR
jgi:hypothetical protein